MLHLRILRRDTSTPMNGGRSTRPSSAATAQSMSVLVGLHPSAASTSTGSAATFWQTPLSASHCTGDPSFSAATALPVPDPEPDPPALPLESPPRRRPGGPAARRPRAGVRTRTVGPRPGGRFHRSPRRSPRSVPNRCSSGRGRGALRAAGAGVALVAPSLSHAGGWGPAPRACSCRPPRTSGCCTSDVDRLRLDAGDPADLVEAGLDEVDRQRRVPEDLGLLLALAEEVVVERAEGLCPSPSVRLASVVVGMIMYEYDDSGTCAVRVVVDPVEDLGEVGRDLLSVLIFAPSSPTATFEAVARRSSRTC